MLLRGANLGVADYSLRVRAGDSAGEASYWTSESSVCTRLSFGTGYMLAVTVSLEMHVATTSSALSFDAALVVGGHKQAGESVAHASTSGQPPPPEPPQGINSAAAGSVEMRLVGHALGFFDYSLGVHIASTSSPRANWLSDSSVSALSASGHTPQSHVVVTVGLVPACPLFALCMPPSPGEGGLGGLTRSFTLSEAVSYDSVRIRSVVEHVITLQPASAWAASALAAVASVYAEAMSAPQVLPSLSPGSEDSYISITSHAVC
jgi:hypothetical protein